MNATRHPARPDDVEPLALNRLLDRRTLGPSDVIDRTTVTINRAEAPLAWLLRRGHVTPAQFAAGERLRSDFHLASLGPRVTMRWDPAPVARGAGSLPDPTETQISARARFDAAAASAGPGLADVLWRVVCLGEGLETAERALGWPSRAGKLVLALALDRLVAHYSAR